MSVKTQTTRFMNTFYPKAIAVLNTELKQYILAMVFFFYKMIVL